MTFDELDRKLHLLRPAELELRAKQSDYARVSEIINRRDSGKILLKEEEDFVDAFYKSFLSKPATTDKTGNFTSEQLFLDQTGLFSIYPHDRFGYCPNHSHDFIECMYVYSGVCRQVINGNEIIMHAGDICMLDLKTKHRILPAGEDDIIINFLMKPSFFQFRFFDALGENDLISDFFLKAIKAKQTECRFLLFKLGSNEQVSWIMNSVMCEYYKSDLCLFEAIISLLSLLFIVLLRFYRDHEGAVVRSTENRVDVGKILSYIRNNYTSCSIDDVALHFHYSPSYLGELLKANIGKSFSALKLDFKLQSSALMLKNSDVPISDILSNVGYSNISYFYRVFKDRYGMTPREYRNACLKTNY